MKFNIYLLFALIAVIASGCTSAKPEMAGAKTPDTVKTQVMLLATLHGIHKINPDYTYADVYDIIRQFNPDVIGVEIRPEDIGQDTSYLKQMYPLEMRQITVLFPKEKLIGFDWYGQEAEGKLLPPDALKGGNNELSKVKLLERQLNADTSLTSQMAMIAVLMNKMQTLAKTSTPATLNNSGDYELTSEIFYDQMEAMMAGLPYEFYTTFNRKRDEQIGKNIVETIKNNPGKKLIFVMGANHRYAARENIRKAFNESVDLVPVPSPK
ncbi:hypothetical protein ACSX1A_14490 [Pontibacter sp. MBLB2868]|uniref:hypothetical protein n=1 Tax=Pontibacter sp. MBLB2868 TaxID=3451555 RepID=UPI003F74C700